MSRSSKKLSSSLHLPRREVIWCWRKQNIEFNVVIKQESHISNLRRNMILREAENCDAYCMIGYVNRTLEVSVWMQTN